MSDYRCQSDRCPSPGPYVSVPDLAQHAWQRHGIEIPDTYAAHRYREPDVEYIRSRCGASMDPKYLAAHQGTCLKCQATIPSIEPKKRGHHAMTKPVPAPAPSTAPEYPMVTVPCGKRMPKGQAAGGHKSKCKACRAKRDQTTPAPARRGRPPKRAPKPRARLERRRFGRQTVHRVVMDVPTISGLTPPSETPLTRVLIALEERIKHLQSLRESLSKEFREA